jgi:ethanolamine ammonia-lyase large subunit
VNYLMGIPVGDDVMLNYETTSFHNNAALRETYGLRPAPEFEAWMEKVGLWAEGALTEKAGDPSQFLRRDEVKRAVFGDSWRGMREATA